MAIFNFNRTFGVEIEVITSHRPATLVSYINDGFIRDGITSPNGADMRIFDAHYSHDTHTIWKIVSDGSLRGRGWEVVSPPMAGMDGMNQIKSVCASLKLAGATVDRSTGLHVHHDVGNLDAKSIGQTFALYATFQNLINYMVAPSRRRESTGYGALNYGSPIEWERITANGADKFDADHRTPAGRPYQPDSIESKMRRRLASDRYNALNIEAVYAHGTLEFRQHQGTINSTKIWNWVLLTQSIIETAIEMRSPVKPTRIIRSEGKPDAYRAKGEFDRFRNTVKASPSANGVPLSHAEFPEDRWDVMNEDSKIYMSMLRYWGKRVKEFGYSG